jgi:L-alanine-DL-glutamate epimerase-like enolase superfamily enzyme
MSESVVSVAAGAHFACAQRNVQYADLDSHFDFEHDVGSGGVRFDDGYLYPLDRPGFGVDVDERVLLEATEASGTAP